MKTYSYKGMTEKQITASFRAERLQAWLAQQPFDAKHNGKMEAVARFLVQLRAWTESSDSGTVAPTFHLCPHAC